MVLMLVCCCVVDCRRCVVGCVSCVVDALNDMSRLSRFPTTLSFSVAALIHAKTISVSFKKGKKKDYRFTLSEKH